MLILLQSKIPSRDHKSIYIKNCRFLTLSVRTTEPEDQSQSNSYGRVLVISRYMARPAIPASRIFALRYDDFAFPHFFLSTLTHTHKHAWPTPVDQKVQNYASLSSPWMVGFLLHSSRPQGDAIE